MHISKRFKSVAVQKCVDQNICDVVEITNNPRNTL